MKTSVQARLDEETQAALERLRRSGMTTSQVIREGIRLVEKQHPARKRPRLVGIGEFESGIPDLASNKKHLADLGVKGMGRGWRRPAERAAE